MNRRAFLSQSALAAASLAIPQSASTRFEETECHPHEPGRPHQPGGADRRSVGGVLLDGALARARGRGDAAGASRDRCDGHVPAGRGDHQGAIEVVGTVSGLDHDGFVAHAEGAVVNCPARRR